MRRNVETEDVRSKAVSRVHAYGSENMQDQPSEAMSPQNVISGFHEHSQMNTIMQQSQDGPPMLHNNSIALTQINQTLLSPPNQIDKGSDDRSCSVNSRGSHIGKNKVYVPHLSFPEDINVDPREKRKVYEKPKGESRFNLKKSTNEVPTGQKKVYGKKAKMLEFNIGDQND